MTVAVGAQRLQVLCCVGATQRYGQHVIKLKKLGERVFTARARPALSCGHVQFVRVGDGGPHLHAP